MSQSTAVSTSAGSPTAPDADETRLHGRWLLVARVGWVALTLLVLTLSAIAIPRAHALLQAVCQPGAQCLGIQLTPADLRQLQHLGLSPGFLAAYQVGWDVATVVTYSALAALIFWRRSSDRMALFCAYTLVLFGGTFTGLLDDGLRPLGAAWYWPVGVLEFLGLVSLLTFFLLFPRGQFVPRWTRWLVLVVILSTAHYVFLTNQLQATQSNNPTDILVFFALVLSLVGLQIYRYRHISTFRERQQTKWVVFGFSLAIILLVVSDTLAHVVPSQQMVQSSVFQILVVGTLSEVVLLIPISIAIAILRAQLYDIDVIINRTLVYGSLTVILGALYAGLIIGLESLAGLISKQASQPVVLVISTLAIFVLFQPLRRRIQSIIDRGFYRRKYDAEKTLAAFSTTLQSEVDLNELRGHLMAVVEETMQPASVSLWLRQPEQHSIEQANRL
jgi:hypothetical protein